MKGLCIVIMFALLLSHISFAQQNTCDYKVEILVDGWEFEKEDFKWRMKATKIEGKSTNITGTAEIKANGKTVKSYKPWTSASISKQKTSNEYSPNLNPGEYEIKAEIEVKCEDTDKDNNIDTKRVKIKGEKEEKTPKKSKEDTAKAENKEVKNEDKQTITPNSENSIPKSKRSYADEETENIIQLKNKNNQKFQETKATTSAVKESQVVYESSNERAKSMIMIFLLTLSILLNIILIWRR